MKTQPELTELICFRVKKSVVAMLERVAARDERRRSDMARLIFVKALEQRDAVKPEKAK